MGGDDSTGTGGSPFTMGSATGSGGVEGSTGSPGVGELEGAVGRSTCHNN